MLTNVCNSIRLEGQLCFPTDEGYLENMNKSKHHLYINIELFPFQSLLYLPTPHHGQDMTQGQIF